MNFFVWFKVLCPNYFWCFHTRLVKNSKCCYVINIVSKNDCLVFVLKVLLNVVLALSLFKMCCFKFCLLKHWWTWRRGVTVHWPSVITCHSSSGKMCAYESSLCSFAKRNFKTKICTFGKSGLKLKRYLKKLCGKN
jgi:hypothetical protein